MKKNLIVFGTRPEAIKMAPLVRIFLDQSECFETKICVTAQHRDMLDQVLNYFDIAPDYDLDIMKSDQDLYSLTGDVINGLKHVLNDFKPDFVYVHGDTTTTMAASLAAYYFGAKICHVEAGLRTFDKLSPFPEEMNRQILGRLADYHFAPTLKSKQNLLHEGVDEDRIVVTGNTVIDALNEGVRLLELKKTNSEIDNLIDIIDKTKKLVLVTGHRRENHGDGMLNICEALKQIIEKDKHTQIIYPVHLNPNVQKPVFEMLKKVKNIHLIDPLTYQSFLWLMKESFIIITDSGGVQEEAPSLGKPVLVMRSTTERPEAVEAGTVLLVGTDKELICKEALILLKNEKAYAKMSVVENPYGDGKASQRIVNFMNKL